MTKGVPPMLSPVSSTDGDPRERLLALCGGKQDHADRIAQLLGPHVLGPIAEASVSAQHADGLLRLELVRTFEISFDEPNEVNNSWLWMDILVSTEVLNFGEEPRYLLVRVDDEWWAFSGMRRDDVGDEVRDVLRVWREKDIDWPFAPGGAFFDLRNPAFPSHRLVEIRVTDEDGLYPGIFAARRDGDGDGGPPLFQIGQTWVRADEEKREQHVVLRHEDADGRWRGWRKQPTPPVPAEQADPIASSASIAEEKPEPAWARAQRERGEMPIAPALSDRVIIGWGGGASGADLASQSSTSRDDHLRWSIDREDADPNGANNELMLDTFLAHMLLNDIVSIEPRGLSVACNEAFDPFAEIIPIACDQILDLYRMWRAAPNGHIAWCVIQRATLPRRPIADAMTKDGWDLDALARGERILPSR